MSSLKQVAAKVNKKWGENVLSADIVDNTQRVSFGTLGADFPTGGGIPRGVIVTASGLWHSGKTTGCAQIMAQYQKEEPNKICVYADVEHTLQSQASFLQKTTGLDMSEDHFMYLDCSGKSAEEIFEILIECEQADDIGLILIDSIAGMVSQSDMDSDFTKDNGMRASIAKSLGKFCRMMVMYLPKRNNTLLLINQVRESKAPNGAIIYSEPCGYGPNYYSAMKIRFSRRTFTFGDKTDLSKPDDADGFRLNFAITKSRYNAIKSGGYLTYRYDTGLDADFDLIEIALQHDMIKRPTSVSYELIDLITNQPYLDEDGNPLVIKGKANVLQYFKDHVEFKSAYVDMVHKYLTNSGVKSLLDENTMNEIIAQDDAIEANVSEEEKLNALTDNE